MFHGKQQSITRFTEQRTAVRQTEISFRVTLFLNNGDIITDVVVEDFSHQGLRLLINDSIITLAQDDIITINVEAHHHCFSKRGRICWLQEQEQGLRLGVSYVDHVGFEPKTHILDVSAVRLNPVCALKLPAHIALRQKVLPFVEINGVIHVASQDADNASVIAVLERILKMPVQLWTSDPNLLDKRLKQVYGETHSLPATPAKPANAQAEQLNAAANAGDDLLYSAYMRQASDIHIDPSFNGAIIRFRVDGQLENYGQVSTTIYTELISRLKVMANLDIAERRTPQDGRFSHLFTAGGRRVDIRVATLPTKYGERITMRLLAVQTDSLTLKTLGFAPEHQRMIEDFLRRIQGMMIMTGPTGSGKTTTLYAAIRMLLEERRVNIITIEDPIEYEIAGIAQCEVDSGDKVSFAKALRSILRHDPDVVMVGEIRDKETADIAIKAALTGHMVLGTLHTNSAAATVTRLIDMGIEPYLVAAALRLAVAQRLLRRLCPHCRIARPLTKLEALSINRPELTGIKIYDPSGCLYCNDKGYAGRIGLYEILELRENWARSVAEGETEADLVVKMRASGVKSLVDDAVDKLIAGITSVSEVVQIASSW
jgi:type IV pilus assembly protein PilB